MWDLIVSVPDHCLSFYFPCYENIDHAAYNASLQKCSYIRYIILRIYMSAKMCIYTVKYLKFEVVAFVL